MKKRILSVFVLAALAALLLAGCGRKKPEATVSPVMETPEPTVDPHEGMIEVPDGSGGTIWVYEAEDLNEFPYDRSLFTVSDSDVTCAVEGLTLLKGIDVSEYQSSIDWTAVRGAGIDFVMLRCGWRGYSGGSLNEDTCFRQNFEGAKAVGLKVGVYFFSQAVSVMEAAEEAVFTARILKGCDLDLPVYFDWENIGEESARTDDVDAATVTAAALEFCRLLESEGYRTGVYGYIPNVYWMYELNELRGMDLWIADLGVGPEFWYDHTTWQYSFSGTVPGIEGNVDMDVIYVYTGTDAEGVG